MAGVIGVAYYATPTIVSLRTELQGPSTSEQSWREWSTCNSAEHSFPSTNSNLLPESSVECREHIVIYLFRESFLKHSFWKLGTTCTQKRHWSPFQGVSLPLVTINFAFQVLSSLVSLNTLLIEGVSPNGALDTRSWNRCAPLRHHAPWRRPLFRFRGRSSGPLSSWFLTYSRLVCDWQIGNNYNKSLRFLFEIFFS